MKTSLLLVVGLLAACGTSPVASPNPNPNPSPSPNPSPNPSPSPSPIAFDVHEWGLIDFAASPSNTTGSLRTGVTTQAPQQPLIMRKPVLYFHTAPDAPPFSVTLGVQMPTGVVAENFPDGTLSAADHGVTWSNILVRPATCTNSRRILANDPSCAATSDGICERTELSNYETTDSACVTYNGAAYNHLFYRAVNVDVRLPVIVEQTLAGLSYVDQPGSRFRGMILRVRSNPAYTTTALAPPIEAQNSTLNELPGPGIDGPARLRAEAIAQGLTEQEADAFMRAWSVELFGAAPPSRVAARMPVSAGAGEVARESGGSGQLGAGRRGLFLPTDNLLYFLPTDIVNTIAPLTITPAAHSVRRVILVRLPVRGSEVAGTS